MILNWRELVRALEHRGDGQYGVHPATGRVAFFDVHALSSEDPRELLDEEVYLMVDPIVDEVVAGWIRAFADEQGPPELAEAALTKNPSRALRKLLAGREELLEGWQARYREHLQEAAERWVETAGLAPENLPPWR